MELSAKTVNPAKGTALISFSYLLERISYYGLRSIIVLYFVNELDLSKGDARDWFNQFTYGVYATVIVGAIIGDFLIGATASIVLGGMMEAAGCFCLAIPGKTTAIIGVILIVVGTGLFKPNVFQQIASLFKGKMCYMDAGYSVVYFAVNVGAFLGVFIIPVLIASESPNYSIGFTAAGIIALLSIVPILFEFKNLKNSSLLQNKSKTTYSANNIISLVAVLLLLPVFWIISSMIGNATFSGNQENNFLWTMIPVLFTIILAGPISVTLWSFVKLDSLYKISIGFFILTFPLIIVAFLSPFIKSLPFLIGVSEVLIVIPVYSVIARFAPPKLTGLFFGISLALNYPAIIASTYIDNLLSANHNAFIFLLLGLSLFVGAIFFILARALPRQEKIISENE